MHPKRGSFGNLSQVSYGSNSRGREGGDASLPTPGYRIDGEVDLVDLVGFKRKFGPVDIDDGPFRCDVVVCTRLQGFRTQEALDRHKRTFH